MMLLSIGDEVREGTYRLHSCFRRAVNFTDGRRLVTLVTPDVGAGPVNIVVRDLTPFALLHDPEPTRAHAPDIATNLAYGRVTDFLNVGVGSLRTGIFNVADLAITCGVGCILLAGWRAKVRAKAETPQG